MEAASRAEFEPLTPDPVDPGGPLVPPNTPRAPVAREIAPSFEELLSLAPDPGADVASSPPATVARSSAPPPTAPAPDEDLLSLAPDPVADTARSPPATVARSSAPPTIAPAPAEELLSAAPEPATGPTPVDPPRVAPPPIVTTRAAAAAGKTTAPVGPASMTTAKSVRPVQPMRQPQQPQQPQQTKPAQPAQPAQALPQVMDRDFVARNQIIERYLSGKLPIKGATEFERFCRANPELLDELGLPERVNAALRLLEAGGKPEPWREQPKRFWETPYLAIALGAAAFVLLIATAVLARNNSQKTVMIASLAQQVAAQPLDPATSTRTIRLLPSREGASTTPAVVIGGGGQTQLAQLLLDMTRSPYKEFRVTIDRIDQGRVAIINNLGKDSNGHLRIALNSSALGPGNYQFTIEGLTWRGDPEPDSWVTIGVQH